MFKNNNELQQFFNDLKRNQEIDKYEINEILIGNIEAINESILDKRISKQLALKNILDIMIKVDDTLIASNIFYECIISNHIFGSNIFKQKIFEMVPYYNIKQNLFSKIMNQTIENNGQMIEEEGKVIFYMLNTLDTKTLVKFAIEYGDNFFALINNEKCTISQDSKDTIFKPLNSILSNNLANIPTEDIAKVIEYISDENKADVFLKVMDDIIEGNKQMDDENNEIIFCILNSVFNEVLVDFATTYGYDFFKLIDDNRCIIPQNTVNNIYYSLIHDEELPLEINKEYIDNIFNIVPNGRYHSISAIISNLKRDQEKLIDYIVDKVHNIEDENLRKKISLAVFENCVFSNKRVLSKMNRDDIEYIFNNNNINSECLCNILSELRNNNELIHYIINTKIPNIEDHDTIKEVILTIMCSNINISDEEKNILVMLARRSFGHNLKNDICLAWELYKNNIFFENNDRLDSERYLVNMVRNLDDPYDKFKKIITMHYYKNIFIEENEERTIKYLFDIIQQTDDVYVKEDILKKLLTGKHALNIYKYIKEHFNEFNSLLLRNFNRETIFEVAIELFIRNIYYIDNNREKTKNFILYARERGDDSDNVKEVILNKILDYKKKFIRNNDELIRIENIINSLNIENANYLISLLKETYTIIMPDFILENQIEIVKKIIETVNYIDINAEENKNIKQIFDIIDNNNIDIDTKIILIQEEVNNLTHDEVDCLTSAFLYNNSNVEKIYITLNKKYYGFISNFINNITNSNIGTLLKDKIIERKTQIEQAENQQANDVNGNFEDVKATSLHTLLKDAYYKYTLGNLDEDFAMDTFTQYINKFDNLIKETNKLKEEMKTLRKEREELERKINAGEIEPITFDFVDDILGYNQMIDDFVPETLEINILEEKDNELYIKSQEIQNNKEQMKENEEKILNEIDAGFNEQNAKDRNKTLLACFNANGLYLNERNLTLEKNINKKTNTQIGTKLYNKLKKFDKRGNIDGRYIPSFY